MTYRIEFLLEGLPKSTNSLRRAGHWSQMYKHSSDWKKKVWLKVVQHGKPKKPLTRARVTLTRYSSTCPDYEGLVSTFKTILDGLIDSQVIIDDNMSVIGAPDYKWEKAKPGKGMIGVAVEEVEAHPG